MAKWPNEIERWRASFAVECIKAHYAGQGIGHEVGDVYTWTHTKAEAEAIAERMNDDAWNPDCWAVTERDQYAGRRLT